MQESNVERVRAKERGIPEMSYPEFLGALSREYSTVVVTGTLPTISREKAEVWVKRAGGKVSGMVSRKTSFVVAGEKAGSKLAKAHELGVPVLDELAFKKRLGL